MNGKTTRDQLARLLALAPYLQSRGEAPLAEVAADFGVTREQILTDLRVLYLCGLPGFGPGDLIDINVESLLDDPDGAVRIDNAEYLARPLRLGSDEAVALMVALRALLDASPAATRPVVERVLAKLEAATEERLDPVVELRLPATTPSARQARHHAERAIGADRQLELGYYVPARDETTTRVVDPIAVLRQDGNTYLDAWCHLAGNRRLFRIDRIVSSAVLESPRARADEPPRDLSRGLFQPGPGDVRARLRLAPSMAWLADYYPVVEVRELADGAREVALDVADERWLQRLALRFGYGLTVLEPALIADRLREVARDALRLQQATAYDGPISDAEANPTE